MRIAQEGTWVFLADPDAVREVFTGDPAVFHAGEANRILRPWLGDNSVLLLDGGPHLAQRRLLLPPFHGERMQRYGGLMTEIAQRNVERWPVEEPLRVWPQMQAVTLDIIVRTIFGVEEGQRMDRLRTRLRDGAEMTTAWPTMLAMALFGPDRVGEEDPDALLGDTEREHVSVRTPAALHVGHRTRHPAERLDGARRARARRKRGSWHTEQYSDTAENVNRAPRNRRLQLEPQAVALFA
jgi:cytochrome P450